MEDRTSGWVFGNSIDVQVDPEIDQQEVERADDIGGHLCTSLRLGKNVTSYHEQRATPYSL